MDFSFTINFLILHLSSHPLAEKANEACAPKRHSAHGISEQHASDTGRGQSRQDPGEQGGQRDLGDVTGAARGDL